MVLTALVEGPDALGLFLSQLCRGASFAFAGLFFWRLPSNIPRFVVALVFKSAESRSFGPDTHVGNEAHEVVPGGMNGNPFRSVCIEAIAGRLVTPLHHLVPAVVCRRFRHAVNDLSH